MSVIFRRCGVSSFLFNKTEGVSKAKKHLQYKSKLATLVKYT